MSVSPNRKRATNGSDDTHNAPHYRSVSQLAYVEHGYAKAVATRTTHPPQPAAAAALNASGGHRGASLSPTRRSVPFTGKSNAEFSYNNTATPAVRPTMKHESGPPKPQPFTADSESRSHLKNFGYCKREIHNPKGQTIQPVPFKGESDSRRCYVDHKITSVPPVKHDVPRPLPNTSFNATSTMRESYSPPRRSPSSMH